MRSETRSPRGFLSTFLTWIALFGALTWLPAPALAQQMGTISGRVVDEQGNAIAGAEVVIDAIRKGAITNATGNYTIAAVPAGTHSVRARFIGYRTQTVTVSVSAGGDVTQDFTLVISPLGLEELVVTGTFTPRVKLEATSAVSTLTSRDLELARPRSTTEMLRYVPGFTRVESSGGEVNQNISIRGILGVEYVMFMEDGLPVFPTMHTFFMNADNLFRADENIERIEVVRGGNASLFGSNTPGAIVNFINKTGGPEFNGTMKVQGATQGLARYDFNFNGPIGDDWRFNVGGFYRHDEGVRDPGFPGIAGGQIKANVTRLLDNGYVRASLKVIDDRNQFILPLPFRDPDDPDYVDGFSNYGSFLSNEFNHIRVPIPTGELELPVENGLRTRASWLTADVGFQFEGGWSVQNSAQIMSNDQEWNAVLPFDVMTADNAVTDYVANYYGRGYFAGQLQGDGTLPSGITIDSATVANLDYDALYVNHFDEFGDRVPLTDPTNGSLNGLLAPGGEWHVEKPISAFQNQLQVRKAIQEHSLALGLYFGSYKQTNRWFFTDILTDVRDNPRAVDLVVNNADVTFYWEEEVAPGDTQVVSQTENVSGLEATRNGFRRWLSNYVNGDGTTTIFSATIGGEFRLSERLRADVGLRYEYNDFVQTSENTATQELDSDPETFFDVELWGNGSFRHFSRSIDDWAGSLGLNYRVNDNVSVYALGSRAFKMPALDEFLNAQAQEQIELFESRETIMGEVGVKYARDRLALAATGFWGELRNIVGQGAEVDATGATTWVVLTSPKTRSWGLELEASGSPAPGWNALAAATLLKAEFGEGGDLGSWVTGVPPVIGNLNSTYTVGGLTLLGDWHYVGRRWVEVDVTELKPYSYLNLGAAYRVPGQNLTISADLQNVYQSKGFEEGNPRLRAVGGLTSDLFLARPILPRRFLVSLRYDF